MDRFHEAINRWAKAKGIDPEKVFTANDWERGEETESGQLLAYCPPIPLRMIVKNPINTSVFEEVIIIEQ